MRVCFPVAFSEQSWIATPVLEKNPPKKNTAFPEKNARILHCPFLESKGSNTAIFFRRLPTEIEMLFVFIRNFFCTGQSFYIEESFYLEWRIKAVELTCKYKNMVKPPHFPELIFMTW